MASRWDTVVPNELYQFPRTMPENLVAIRENARRRPYYCYRLFINNVDQYVSREIAKASIDSENRLFQCG
ncbi:Hypothetical protein NTJ_11588 [Nesidiocoris tenuis]|uniref:Uncharacterized protein n=1 Tax=Nesidiocoris tenuis TaxID=355587 RepID=A0ABN7B2Y1_9HEMI|nr:Hypothetical protein NTJ_11588 [Nesidiocoris tenuis]